MSAPRKVNGFKYQPSVEEESEITERVEEFNHVIEGLKLVRCITPGKAPLEEEPDRNEYILEMINRRVRSLQTKPEKKMSEMVPDRKSTRLNSSHYGLSRMPSSA